MLVTSSVPPAVCCPAGRWDARRRRPIVEEVSPVPLPARSLPFATADRGAAVRRPGAPPLAQRRRRHASAALLATATLLTLLACAGAGAPPSGGTPSGAPGDADTGTGT